MTEYEEASLATLKAIREQIAALAQDVAWFKERIETNDEMMERARSASDMFR